MGLSTLLILSVMSNILVHIPPWPFAVFITLGVLFSVSALYFPSSASGDTVA